MTSAVLKSVKVEESSIAIWWKTAIAWITRCRLFRHAWNREMRWKRIGIEWRRKPWSTVPIMNSNVVYAVAWLGNCWKCRTAQVEDRAMSGCKRRIRNGLTGWKMTEVILSYVTIIYFSLCPILFSIINCTSVTKCILVIICLTETINKNYRIVVVI